MIYFVSGAPARTPVSKLQQAKLVANLEVGADGMIPTPSPTPAVRMTEMLGGGGGGAPTVRVLPGDHGGRDQDRGKEARSPGADLAVNLAEKRKDPDIDPDHNQAKHGLMVSCHVMS